MYRQRKIILWFHGWIIVSSMFLLARSQMISYGMRRLSMSMNQFGFDMLRSIERIEDLEDGDGPQPTQKSYAFCPFCVGSSLAMLMAGLAVTSKISDPKFLEGQFQPTENNEIASTSLYETLQYALYLNTMQPQEIHLAFIDLMQHFQVNLPEGFRPSSMDQKINSNVDEDGSGSKLSKNFPGNYSLQIINQIYIQRYLPIDYNYYVLTQHYYRTPIRSLDFAYASEESRAHINAVVEQATNQKLNNVLPSSFSGEEQLSNIRLLFLSGLYFEAKLDFRETRARGSVFQRFWPWHGQPWFQYQPFRPQQQQYQPLIQIQAADPIVKRPQSPQPTTTTAQQTDPRPSLSLPPVTVHSTSSISQSQQAGVPVKTKDHHHHQNHHFDPFKPLPTVNQVLTKENIRLRHSHSPYLNTTMVEMPFVNGILSIFVMIPDDPGSFDLLLHRLNAQLIIDLMQTLETKRLDITVPLINISYTAHNLQQVFDQMGLSKIFETLLLKSNQMFAGIDDFPLSRMMQINHKTVLNIGIEENGESLGSRVRRHTEESTSPADTVTESKVVSSSIIEIVPSKKILAEHPRTMAAINRQPSDQAEPSRRRPTISLEEDFIFLIIDNVSGLIVTMGKYHQSFNHQKP